MSKYLSQVKEVTESVLNSSYLTSYTETRKFLKELLCQHLFIYFFNLEEVQIQSIYESKELFSWVCKCGHSHNYVVKKLCF